MAKSVSDVRVQCEAEVANPGSRIRGSTGSDPPEGTWWGARDVPP